MAHALPLTPFSHTSLPLPKTKTLTCSFFSLPPMEFWGAEVKVGEVVKVGPSEFEACIHLSQAALGESKKDKEPVVLYLKVGDQKFVLGTLSREKIPQVSLEIVLDKEFELSHNSKTASVHLCGYKAYYLADESDADDYSESDEDIPLLTTENGKLEVKVTESKKADAKSGASKQVKVVDPKKDENDDPDDEMADADSGSDSDESDNDEEDEETPVKKVDKGKKRPNESASKTPVSTKKAKNATHEKTDGKKAGDTTTPHPKKGGKTPNSEAKAKTPKSGGQFSCEPCSKSFNSESGFQQHKKAKHDDK